MTSGNDVEAVARALCPSPDEIWFSDGQAKARDYFRSQAQAAIAALNIPALEANVDLLKGQWEVEIAENIKNLARITALEARIDALEKEVAKERGHYMAIAAQLIEADERAEAVAEPPA